MRVKSSVKEGSTGDSDAARTGIAASPRKAAIEADHNIETDRNDEVNDLCNFMLCLSFRFGSFPFSA